MKITILILLGIGIANSIFAICHNLCIGADLFAATGGLLQIASFAGKVLAFIYILKTKRMVK